MILSCHGLTKSFGDNRILQDVSFHIERREKTAVIGVNGAGKTTLLRILAGELKPDRGSVTFAKDTTLGYLAQNQGFSGDGTIYEALKEAKREAIDLEAQIRDTEQRMRFFSGEPLQRLMETYAQMTERFQLIGGYAWQSEITGVARGLGFSDQDMYRPAAQLSGGQKTRLALGRLLLQMPDIILLDEPTNHLDMRSVRWLESYLAGWRGAVLVVSHDRYFLDRIAGKIIEIEYGRAQTFSGGYTAYADKKAALRAAAWHAYVSQQKEIKRQEEVIARLKSFNREKSVKRAESREKMLQKVERLEKPLEAQGGMRITLTPRVMSGGDVLHVEHLRKAFGANTLFSDISFDLRRGERVAVIGDNGVGKTTLLRILTGLLAPDAGTFRLGTNVRIGYYDQEQQLLHDGKTLFDEISDDYPALNQTQIRNTLAAFLFTGDDVYKQTKMLSGGERGRLSLAKLMLSEANLLLLDEPTNHLDITGKEVLESALTGYEGTVLCVSHDRYFINRIATRILDLTHAGLIDYIGNYEDYLAHVDERMARASGQHTPLSGRDTALTEPVFSETTRDTVGRSQSPAQSPATTQSSAAARQTAGGSQAPAQSPSTARQTADEPQDLSAARQPAFSRAFAAAAALSAARTDGAAEWKSQKEAQAQRRKAEAALRRCEDAIAALEARNTEINAEMSLQEVATNAVKLRVLAEEQEKINAKLTALYDEWELLV